jgi:hypothetical protein
MKMGFMGNIKCIGFFISLGQNDKFSHFTAWYILLYTLKKLD